MPPDASLEDVFEIAPNWYCLVALEAGYEAERDGCAGIRAVHPLHAWRGVALVTRMKPSEQRPFGAVQIGIFHDRPRRHRQDAPANESASACATDRRLVVDARERGAFVEVVVGAARGGEQRRSAAAIARGGVRATSRRTRPRRELAGCERLCDGDDFPGSLCRLCDDVPFLSTGRSVWLAQDGRSGTRKRHCISRIRLSGSMGRAHVAKAN